MSRLRLTVALALLAAPAAAQQFTPQTVFTSIIETQKRYILRLLDVAPDSMMTYRPSSGVRTFAEQIEHAAGSDAFIAHLVIAGGPTGMPMLGDSLVYRKNKAALRDFVAKSMDHAVAMIGAVSNDDMLKEVTLFGNKMPRHRALMLLLDHFPWTLGQTVPYLRLNGVTPPAYAPF